MYFFRVLVVLTGEDDGIDRSEAETVVVGDAVFGLLLQEEGVADKISSVDENGAILWILAGCSSRCSGPKVDVMLVGLLEGRPVVGGSFQLLQPGREAQQGLVPGSSACLALSGNARHRQVGHGCRRVGSRTTPDGALCLVSRDGLCDWAGPPFPQVLAFGDARDVWVPQACPVLVTQQSGPVLGVQGTQQVLPCCAQPQRAPLLRRRAYG